MVWKIVGSIITIATFVGVLVAADNYVAHAEDLRLVSERLDHKIVSDRIADIDERMWQIELRWQEQFKQEFNRFPNGINELLPYMSEDAREYYKKLKTEKDQLERELQVLVERQKKG